MHEYSKSNFVLIYCERLASFYNVCCINLGSDVSKTVHLDQLEMCRMFLFVMFVFDIQQYRIWLKKGQGTHREQKVSACMMLTKDVHGELGNSSRQT